MYIPINGLQQNHMDFGAFKNCSVLFDPCVSMDSITCIKRDTNFNWKIYFQKLCWHIMKPYVQMGNKVFDDRVIVFKNSLQN